jgi:WhiB family redox-sensing transcriptional regulator
MKNFAPTETDVAWQQKALCLGWYKKTGVDLFFSPEDFVPNRGVSRIKQARRMCDVCPVKSECLRYASENDCIGFWGGMTEAQRRRVKKN